MMQLFHIVAEVIHLLVVAVAAAGPLVCIVLNAKQLNRKNAPEREALWTIGTRMGQHANRALLLGSVMGLVVAAMISSDEVHQRCHVVQDRFLFAGIEWIFSWVLLLFTQRWWKSRPDGLKSFVVRSVVILLATTNLLYHFPILFMLINELPVSLVVELESTSSQLSRAQFYEYAFTNSMLARWLHTVVSLVMVAVAYTAVISLRYARDVSGVPRDVSVRIVNWTARTIVFLLFIQIGLGLLTVMTMPDMKRIMGGNVLVTALFAGAMCLLLIQLQQWTSLMSRRVDPQAVARAVTTLIALFSCMTAVSILN